MRRSYDVVIAGAGLIGGAIAYGLARQKLRVALFEQGKPGREASWAAAGMLSPVPDLTADIPLVPFGVASLRLYPEFIAEVEAISGQRTAFRREGAIEVLFSEDAEAKLSARIALHHSLGLPTESLPPAEARRLEPALSQDARATALLPYECSIDNRALIKAVLSAAASAGVELYATSRITRLMSQGNRCTGAFVSRSAEPPEDVAAGNVVLCAGAFSANIEGVSPPIAVWPIRGQMAALLNSGIRLRRVLRSEHGYIVPRDDDTPQRLVTGSTLEDVNFDKQVTPRGLGQIFAAGQQLVPGLSGVGVTETWCGLRPDTPDHLPILGPSKLENCMIATGHYRNGILLAPITAKLVTEWITNLSVSMDWSAFSPLRFMTEANSENPSGVQC